MTKKHHKDAALAHAGASQPTEPIKAAVALSDNGNNGRLVSDEAVRLCAYQKWEAAGNPSGDGIHFWLQAEQELREGKNEKLVQRGGWPGQGEHDRQEADKAVKEGNKSVDSHYRDNNRMFQSHGERGHRHGGNG
jgi:hypothetical protein